MVTSRPVAALSRSATSIRHTFRRHGDQRAEAENHEDGDESRYPDDPAHASAQLPVLRFPAAYVHSLRVLRIKNANRPAPPRWAPDWVRCGTSPSDALSPAAQEALSAAGMTQNPPDLRPDLAPRMRGSRDERPPRPADRIGMVSLGCPKALVDSERILTRA
jgi:hypothetical protein